MSASEKVVEALFLGQKEGNKEFKYSILKSNGFVPQAVLANEVGNALTEQIKNKNKELGSVLDKFDTAFDLGLISTRSDNGWFTDVLTSHREKRSIQVTSEGGKKPNAMAAMMGGGGSGGQHPQQAV